jgi:hypothetical protein
MIFHRILFVFVMGSYCLNDASKDDTTIALKVPESANVVNEREESERGEIEMGCQKQVNTKSSLQAKHMDSW